MDYHTINFHNLFYKRDKTDHHFRHSNYIKVFVGMVLFFLILRIESFGCDAASYTQCTLLRNSEDLDSSAALPKMIRFSNHENSSYVVPNIISANCFEFYRPDGTLVLPGERLLSVNLIPPNTTEFRIISNQRKSFDIQIDNDCQVTRVKQGVVVQTSLYEWQLASGCYIMVVRWDSPSTVFLDGRLERSNNAFGKDARLVNILSTPILVHVR